MWKYSFTSAIYASIKNLSRYELLYAFPNFTCTRDLATPLWGSVQHSLLCLLNELRMRRSTCELKGGSIDFRHVWFVSLAQDPIQLVPTKVENSKTKMGIEETHERWRRGILTTSNVEQQVIDMRLYIEVRFGFEKNIEK